MLGRTVKCGSLRVLLIFLTQEGGGLVGGFVPGPWALRNAHYPRPKWARRYSPGTQSPLFSGPDGATLQPIRCLRRVPERRRFPGGGSGSPVARRLSPSEVANRPSSRDCHGGYRSRLCPDVPVTTGRCLNAPAQGQLPSSIADHTVRYGSNVLSRGIR
jgi:hypothetical protein